MSAYPTFKLIEPLAQSRISICRIEPLPTCVESVPPCFRTFALPSSPVKVNSGKLKLAAHENLK